MKYLLALSLFLTGCGATKVNYTVFLKEKSVEIKNLKGETCISSGYQLYKEGAELITFYENCEVHYYRKLEEFEIKQWPQAPNK